MNALKALCVVGVVAALLSCAAEQKPIEITSAQAMGTVGGLVLDAATREPLSGVNVTLLAGGLAAAAMTNATGGFAFAEVPSGEVSVTLDVDDYLSAILRGTLQGAGEYPIDNATLTFGPIGLIPASGTFSALLMFDDGSPAGDVPVTARTTTRFYDYANDDSATGDAQTTTVAARTDGAGLVSFTGLPDFILLGEGTVDLLTIVVPPIAAASGSPSLFRFPGGAYTYHMTAVGSLTPTIVLEPPTAPGPLKVTASNIRWLEAGGATALPSIIGGGGPVFVAFNQPLDPTATSVTLWEEGSPAQPAREQTNVVQQVVSYNTLQLSFSPDLSQASEYNLVIHAVAGLGDQLVRYDSWAPFFTPLSATMARPTLTREVIDLALHTEVMHLAFPEPVGTGSAAANLTGFGLDDCVLFFTYPLTNGNGNVGDDPGETGNENCRPDLILVAEEPDPTGASGLSGYTKYWKFNMPVLGPPASPSSVPAGTSANIVLSRVTTTGLLMKRVNGQPVPDFVGTLNLVLP